MSYAERLKALRLECGMTQSELAKKSNLAPSCIAMIELGKREPSANTLISLANALNVSADYILGLENDFGVRTTQTNTRYSFEERQIIEDYRLLNPECKQLIKQTLQTLKASPAGTAAKNKAE